MNQNIAAYLSAIENLAKFDAQHVETLSKRSELEKEVLEAENAVKSLVVASGESLNIPSIATRFTYVQAFEKNVSHEKAVSLIEESLKGNKKQMAVSALNGISQIVVDPTAFIELVKAGVLPNQVRAALTETAKKPYVSKRSIKTE